MNTDKHGWGKLFEGRARYSVRAEVCIPTSGGQPPSRRSGALARREGGRTPMNREQAARPANQSIFHPCPSVPHCGIRGFFIFFVS
jgi:hypothetical protein